MSYNSPTVIHIRSVSGSIVYYRRDSVTTDVPLNVASITSYSPWWFVSQNMVTGDLFQVGIPKKYFVNATITKSFAGQSWAANRINATSGAIIINALFDQITGLMLYWYHTDGSSYENEFYLTSWGTETETPTTPIQPAWIIVMAIAGIGLSIMLASRKTTIRSANE